MSKSAGFESAAALAKTPEAHHHEDVFPRHFNVPSSGGADAYFNEPAIADLATFFQNKTLAVLKEEDRREQWYDDWLEYQKQRRIYATILSPKAYAASSAADEARGLDLLRLMRFAEVFGYFSPAHGYSFQVTFLGLIAILMGDNEALKREAVGAVERGGVLAFGVSEKHHGSDLLGNEFAVHEIEPGRFRAEGGKYYIGNANCAAIIAVLAHKHTTRSAGRSGRAPVVMVALRPSSSPAMSTPRKIRTLGVRAAFVGALEVKGHEFSAADIIAEGRRAWDAVAGAVTLGKFVLGFGSIGICERALEEAAAHLSARTLYRKSALAMPHIRLMTAQACARLTAMKLYAYRALDYLHAATPADRRHLLYCAVQKTKVSTEGVKVIAQLSECIGAKGFESDTYFESALRDILLFPGLESSTHINLNLIVQFIPRYFRTPAAGVIPPPSLTAAPSIPAENAYLFDARSGRISDIGFAHVFTAYEPLMHGFNVRTFVRQIRTFRLVLWSLDRHTALADPPMTMAAGQCVATIAYAQLIAEAAAHHRVNSAMVAAIFHLLVNDLSRAAQTLGALPGVSRFTRALARRMIAIPRASEADWDFAAAHLDRMIQSAAVATPAPHMAERADDESA